ncbi:orotate phosphoribosyltransferase [Ferroglobus placidus DSM 10642]|uniref:Orotate phosphoribosyltransferase n=1 Tax=Ferroglobus placidus (strain DSM 10642 / AEDII12DO) TaxID=589924 RepID=D3S087_FERPA|nr:orotate phosphoribosyltransferase [Ferroglobus placidus]ADC66150.1 orotate phosphoribosyltransferase [Ferroglobus placidus DSM 10642]
MEKFELVKMLYDAGAVKFGEFVLSSGKRSNVYVDFKKASTKPKILKTFAKELISKINFDFDKIACIELGGVPLAVAVALDLEKDYVIFRKKKKEYGAEEEFVGEVRSGEKFLVVEDVITTGSSAKSIEERLKKFNAEVVAFSCAVDREESSLNPISVLKLSDILKFKEGL